MFNHLCSALLLTVCGAASGQDNHRTAVPVLAQAATSSESRPQGKPARPAPSANTAASAIGADPGTTGALLAPTKTGLAAHDPRLKRLYGPGVLVIDALADVNIGNIRGTTYIASHRFRATSGGRVTSVRAYWPAGSGYSAGNGGTISVRILPDDGSPANLPNLGAPPLATGLYSPGLVMGRHVMSSFNDEVRMGSMTPLVAGQLYHVVYQNISPDPASDWIGVNNIVTVERNGRPARWLDPTDWSVLFGYRPAGSNAGFTWKDATRTTNSGLYYAPILQLGLDSGAFIGAAKIETGNTEGERLTAIGATQAIRERFTPAAARRISGFSVSTATTTGGELEWSLRQGDTVLASGVISEPGANYSNQMNVDIMQGVFRWYDIALPSPVSFQAAATYDLEFTPKGNSQWRFASEYSGSNRKFNVAFAESQAQSNLKGKWVNTTHRTHVGSNPAANWRVVLHLAP